MLKRLRIFPNIDRYLLGEVVPPFLGGIVFFVFIFLMFQLLRLADFFIIHGVSLLVLGKLTSLMIMTFLPIAIPIAFLIGVLIGFGRLSSDSELVALKASGVSVTRMAAPILLFSVLVTGLSLGLNLQWVPWAQRTLKSTIVKISNTKAVTSIKEGTFTSGFFDLLVFADKVDTKTNQLERVFIYDEREPKNPHTVVANSGELLSVKGKNEITSSALLRLYNGTIHRNDSENSTYQKIDFREYRLFLSVGEGTEDTVIKPNMLSLAHLRDLIHGSDPKSFENRKYSTEFFRRYFIALSPLIYVFMGIGFGTIRTRAIRSSSTIIAFAIVLLYWSLDVGATELAYKGLLPPLLSTFLPSLILAAIAFFGFKRATW